MVIVTAIHYSFRMFWIIFNLTSSFTPLQLTEKFYRLMRMARKSILMCICSAADPSDACSILSHGARLQNYNTQYKACTSPSVYDSFRYAIQTRLILKTVGLNFGVLIAIIAVDCCGMALFIAIERRRSDKNERKEQEEKEKEESGPKEKPKKNNV